MAAPRVDWSARLAVVLENVRGKRRQGTLERRAAKGTLTKQDKDVIGYHWRNNRPVRISIRTEETSSTNDPTPVRLEGYVVVRAKNEVEALDKVSAWLQDNLPIGDAILGSENTNEPVGSGELFKFSRRQVGGSKKWMPSRDYFADELVRWKGGSSLKRFVL